MKRSVWLGMMLVLLVGASCSQMNLFSGQPSMADQVNGTWEGVLDEMGGMELVYTFNVEGDTLDGTVSSDMGEMPLSNGTVAADSFSFQVDAGGQMITHNCTVSGDTITIAFPEMGNTMTLTRVSE